MQAVLGFECAAATNRPSLQLMMLRKQTDTRWVRNTNMFFDGTSNLLPFNQTERGSTSLGKFPLCSSILSKHHLHSELHLLVITYKGTNQTAAQLLTCCIVNMPPSDAVRN